MGTIILQLFAIIEQLESGEGNENENERLCSGQRPKA